MPGRDRISRSTPRSIYLFHTQVYLSVLHRYIPLSSLLAPPQKKKPVTYHPLSWGCVLREEDRVHEPCVYIMIVRASVMTVSSYVGSGPVFLWLAERFIQGFSCDPIRCCAWHREASILWVLKHLVQLFKWIQKDRPFFHKSVGHIETKVIKDYRVFGI